MSELGRKHECHEIANDCPQHFRLYGGQGKNYLFAFHFENTAELETFLHAQGWTVEQRGQLYLTGEVTLGGEWARLEKRTENVHS